jgi:hypothetical protein
MDMGTALGALKHSGNKHFIGKKKVTDTPALPSQRK